MLMVNQNLYLGTVTEILQSIRQAEMSPMLQRLYESEGGTELCDVLMKYMYVPPRGYPYLTRLC